MGCAVRVYSYVDAQQALHLSITNHGSAEAPEWHSTEVILRESLGYGTYLYVHPTMPPRSMQQYSHPAQFPGGWTSELHGSPRGAGTVHMGGRRSGRRLP